MQDTILSANPLTSRRSMISASITAAIAASSLTRILLAEDSSAAQLPPKKLLFFTKSAGFEHDVVRREGEALAYAERIMVDLGKKHGIEVECSKDGRVFDEEFEKYDGYLFYTTENLTEEGNDKQPPLSEQGKRNLLESIKNGKGFAGSHCATDTFHTPGDRFSSQSQPDPYIKMIGGEFIRHGRQQPATMRVSDAGFPGLKTVGESFQLNEEWYSLKNFAPDLHVILVQETEGMVDDDYKRPPFPATWARHEGKGRVFYTSMGHREDVWTNPIFESILIGGLNWSLGRIDAQLTPNLSTACPGAATMPPLKA